ALNPALELAARGILERYGVELIGADVAAIRKAEDRDLFKQAMLAIGLEVPRSGFATSLDEAMAVLREVGLPAIIRPSRTLGGTGGSIAETAQEYAEAVTWGLDASPIRQLLIEESIAGWKEFEREVRRDKRDNDVIACSIENFEPLQDQAAAPTRAAPAHPLTEKDTRARG